MTPPLATQARWVLHRHGWAALAGVLALVLAVGLDMATRELLAQTQAQELAHQTRLQRERERPDPAAEQAARLAELQRDLPDAAAALQVLPLIHRAAQAHGVVLASGEYRLLPEGKAGTLARYQITLPASGSYPALRAWTAEVLNAQPSLAMEELSLSRPTSGETTLQARVRWSLYLKAR
ncbi:GspMb/PilO family protein [Hydrogenophaga sp.]|uniref:GspMb/PilO family protein n=1 Tax=Hydrogenophaga sp. TaxID=1904254 RepID=UPI003919CCB6